MQQLKTLWERACPRWRPKQRRQIQSCRCLAIHPPIPGLRAQAVSPDYLDKGLALASARQRVPFAELLRKGWAGTSNCCVEKSRFFDSLVSF
jgi:hypothetical protein